MSRGEEAPRGTAVIVADARGRVVAMNPVAETLTGWPPGEAAGQPLATVFRFEHEQTRRPVAEVFATAWPDHTVLRAPDGTEWAPDGDATPIRDGGGAVTGAVLVFRDIREGRRAEAALAAANAARGRAEAARRDVVRRLVTAQEDERRRIARELHDQMGQYLAALGLGLKALEAAAPDPSPAARQLRQLRGLTDLIGTEVHNLALEIRPTALDDLGLAAALSTYAEEWAARSGVRVDFHAAGLDRGRLPAAVETAVYRVAQEALTNVSRHARARRVSLVVQRTARGVVAVVEDDGRGFDPAAAAGRLGLVGMRERVELVDGELTVESTPGGGTTVIARIPLSADEGSE